MGGGEGWGTPSGTWRPTSQEAALSFYPSFLPLPISPHLEGESFGTMGLEVEVQGEQLEVAVADVLGESRAAGLRVWGRPQAGPRAPPTRPACPTWLCWNRSWTLA